MNKHVYMNKTQNEIEHGDSMLLIAGAAVVGVALLGNVVLAALKYFGI